MGRICMLVRNTVDHDSRVHRSARRLSRDHAVLVVGLARRPHERGLLEPCGDYDVYRSLFEGNDTGHPWREFFRRSWLLGTIGSSWRWLRWFVGSLRALLAIRADVYHAHDVDALPACVVAAARHRGRVVYDAHEVAVHQLRRATFNRWLVGLLERLLIPRLDGFITVSNGASAWFSRAYDLAAPSIVLRNVPDLEATGGGACPHTLAPSPAVLHVGGMQPGRGLDVLIQALRYRETDWTVHLLGTGDDDYQERLRRLAADAGAPSKVRFHPAVPREAVLDCVRQATVGVSLLQDTCFNHRIALPNKLFQYIGAAVPVVASDLPEMRQLIEEHHVGVVCRPDDPAAVAEAIEIILDRHGEYALACAVAARGLSWGTEARRLDELYRRVLTT